MRGLIRLSLSPLAVCLLLALSACAVDDQKTTGQSCASDSECGDGVCFDTTCYSACTSQEDCAGEAFCVQHKTEDDQHVNICETASDFSGCATDETVCDTLVAAPCEEVGCDAEAGLCAFSALPDGEACETVEGYDGICGAGICVCTPSCEGRDCGEDGCGGSCGTCGAGTHCNGDYCLEDGCEPDSPSTEVCDGRDNDCDGLTDAEDDASGGGTELSLPLCERQVGVCGGATKRAPLCVGGTWHACFEEDYAAHAPSFEPNQEISCDGLDNDCDGQTDEDFSVSLLDGGAVSGVGEPCGVGVCAGGFTACDPSGLGVACDAEEGASPELCDGIDNDCDGLLDLADDADLSANDAQPCELQAGVCAGAAKPVTLCVEGSWQPCHEGDYLAASADYQDALEVACDGQDNDCDGETDEDFTLTLLNGYTVSGLGATCGSGECHGGETVCAEAGDAIVCTTEAGASPEVCDGLDNDCDGQFDDELPETQACEISNEWGACLGQATCGGLDGWICDAPAPAEELCDGADNDCDGLIDEGFIDTDGDGLADCVDPDDDDDQDPDETDCAGTDPAIHHAAVEACDEVDNDCDEQIDPEGAEGCVMYFRDGDDDQFGVDGRCLCQVEGDYTALAAGDCDDAVAAVNPEAAEVCNLIDDDCDGLTDAGDEDDLLSHDVQPCELVDGVCAGATKPSNLCVEGAWQPCDDAWYAVHSMAYQAGTELTCDGLDNDCDGAADEDFALTLLDGAEVVGVGQACGTGACGEGLTTCNDSADGVTCAVELEATPERCDGLDNDCDGLTDAEDAADLLANDLQPCELQDGACLEAVKPPELCVEGAWSDCTSEHYAGHSPLFQDGAEAACDGVDNDCDGAADEDFTLSQADGSAVAGVGVECGLGVCAGGLTACNTDADGLVCSSDDLIVDEACDGLDDDCDGETDEGLGPQPCEATVEGVGICAGEATCQGASGWVCDAPEPELEVCDEVDNDCDGETDEDFKIDGVVAVFEHCGACDATCEGVISDAQAACQPDGPDGPRCVVDACEDGFVQADETSCVAATIVTCTPCDSDDDCPAGACLPLDGAGFCMLPCDLPELPEGHACVDLAGGGQAILPANGSCTCDDANEGMTRACQVINDVGACVGTEICSAEHGWGDCSAAEPAPEDCDGIDNDCDGEADEELIAQPCTIENEYGACAGMLGCQAEAGWVCDAAEPAPEICDGVDNDCDAEIDEDFMVDGVYATFDHCGACGATCGDAIPFALATCQPDGPDGPRCVVEGCEEGYVQADETSCVSEVTVTCAACMEDADCLAGACLPLDGEQFCLLPCAPELPEGFTCAELEGGQMAMTPGNGSCTCDAGADGQQRDCEISNASGACQGTETCDPAAGWSACTAATPVEEACNGVDDDCDAEIDEGLVGEPCTNENAYGVCAGLSSCQGAMGWVCDAAEPALEACDDLDNDCDGATDEDFPDNDADGSADCVDDDDDNDGVLDHIDNCSMVANVLQGNYDMDDQGDACDDDDDNDGTSDDVDCEPTNAAIYPGAIEVCDGQDNDCDGSADAGYPDNDVDGIADCVDPDDDNDGDPDTSDCAPLDSAIYHGGFEICDGVDNDCDGGTDEGSPNSDGDALANCVDPDDDNDGDPDGTDCRPYDDGIHHGADELCDGVDNDCDLAVDEDAIGCIAYYRDDDNDGFGVAETSCLCAPEAPYTASKPGDCRDVLPLIHPDASEICDALDNDCDGLTDASDSDLTSDDPQLCEMQAGECSGATKTPAQCVNGAWDECGVAAYSAHNPWYEGGYEESCDGRDNDCDGEADEDFTATMLNGSSVMGVGETCGVGVCAGGTTVCNGTGNGVICSSEHMASAELCNGLDDDCDGATDTADPGLTADDPQPCEKQAGVCSGATKLEHLCVSGAWSTCGDLDYVAYDALYQGAEETSCDNADNDCDGMVDEDFTLTLLDGTEVSGVGQACGAGVCAGGTTACSGSSDAIVCPSEGAAGAEACNDVDDDCDGLTDAADEDLAASAPPCEQQAGACAGAVKPPYLCTAGAWSACATSDYAAHNPTEYEPIEFTCDGVDNDCDAQIDAGFVDTDGDTQADCVDPDDDDDGILDDGGGSGSDDDQPCADLQVSGCDDNCRLTANADQANLDNDAPGNACDDDDDGDGVTDVNQGGTDCDDLAADAFPGAPDVVQGQCETYAPGWTVDTTDLSGGKDAYENALAVDDQGHVHIMYLTRGQYDLHYLTNASGAWVDTPITLDDKAISPDMAVTGGGDAFFSFEDAITGELVVYAPATGVWGRYTVVSDIESPRASLAVADDGTVHLAFQQEGTTYPDADLRYATGIPRFGLTLSDVHTGGSHGFFSDIALSAGAVHIAYWDRNDEDLEYAHYQGGSWSLQTIASTGMTGRAAVLDVDGDGYAHISYLDDELGQLRYTTNMFGSWTFQNLSNDAMYSSIHVDPNGFPADVSYPESADDDVYLSSNSGGTWSSEKVYTGMVGQTSLDADPEGYLHMSMAHNTGSIREIYYATNRSGTCAQYEDHGRDTNCDELDGVDADGDGHATIASGGDDCDDSQEETFPGALDTANNGVDENCDGVDGTDSDGDGYAADAGDIDCDDANPARHPGVLDRVDDSCAAWSTSWTPSTIDTGGNVGRYVDMVMDGSGNLHLAYEDYTNRDLKYASNQYGYFMPEIVESDGNVGSYCSITLDGSGYPRISYLDDTNSDLELASYNPLNAWTSEVLYNTSRVSGETSVGVLSDGFNAVAFRTSSGYDLTVISGTTGAWSTSQVDTTVTKSGWANALAVDNANKLHVAYRDEDDYNLKYATNRSGAWVTTTVDGSASLAYEVDVAVDAYGWAHITYKGLNYNGTGNFLRYATNRSGAWQAVTLDKDYAGHGCSIAIGPDRAIFISYSADTTGGHVMLATNRSGAWERIMAAEDADAFYTAIVVDDGGNPRIAYYDDQNDDLELVTGITSCTSLTPANDDDSDCDGVDGTDADRDGYPSVESGGTDCNDMDSAINPAAFEACDHIDNNCNGIIDEGCV